MVEIKEVQADAVPIEVVDVSDEEVSDHDTSSVTHAKKLTGYEKYAARKEKKAKKDAQKKRG